MVYKKVLQKKPKIKTNTTTDATNTSNLAFKL